MLNARGAHNDVPSQYSVATIFVHARNRSLINVYVLVKTADVYTMK